MTKPKIFIATVLIALTFIACKSKIKTVSGQFDYSDYETECVSLDRTGVQTVKAWGLGRTEKEAILNARRRAVDDILFMGIRGGNSGCSVRPIISNPNIRRDQSQYFYAFFAENGSFERYAGIPEENWLRQKLNINKKNNDNRAYEIIIEVDVEGLKAHMKRDRIIQ